MAGETGMMFGGKREEGEKSRVRCGQQVWLARARHPTSFYQTMTQP